MSQSDQDSEYDYDEDLKDWAGSWIKDVQKLIKEDPELTERALCWLYAKGALQGMKAMGWRCPTETTPTGDRK